MILAAADGARASRRSEVVVVFPYADPQTHSFQRARASCRAQETGLHPGMTVKVAFTVGEAQRAAGAGQRRCVQRSEVSAVYVVDAQATDACARCASAIASATGSRCWPASTAGERIAVDPVAAGAVRWRKSRRGCRRP